MHAGYPLTKEGKKVHAVREDSMYEYVSATDTDGAKIIGLSACDHRVELRGSTEFDPAADNACSRCSSAAKEAEAATA